MPVNFEHPPSKLWILNICWTKLWPSVNARLAQSVERKTLNLVVVGSSPTVGIDHSARCLP